MEAWATTGRPIDEFWGLTFREIQVVFNATSKIQHNALEIAYYNAYYSGLLSQNYKKFPKFEQLAPRARLDDQEPTKESISAGLRLFAAAFGVGVNK